MSGLKTEIIEFKGIKGEDSLCLDQYPDGSVRLLCDQDFIREEQNGICKYRTRAMIHLSKREMLKLISTYLRNDLVWSEIEE